MSLEELAEARRLKQRAPIADPDRQAAEYVLTIGGSVSVNDEDGFLKAVADLPRGAFRLTVVFLDDNPHLADKGLAVFKDCKNLRSLLVRGTKVSDVGLANFKGCKNLTWLNLHDTQVTDVGLANFKECKDLTHLWLINTKVTDAGLAQFKGCKNLVTLGLQETKVTAAMIEDLRKSLPKCEITWDGGVVEPKVGE